MQFDIPTNCTMKKAKAKAQVKKPLGETAESDFIPPLYFKHHGKPADPDPPRGSVTEGLGIIPAFSALVQEGKVVQYMLLRAAVQVGPKINLGHDLWKGFLTEQLGIIGKGCNPLTIAQGMRDNHHGQTLNRSCRERVWEAAVPRLCTDEEIAKGCRDCGSRIDADGATLVDDSNRWYKVRFHYEQGPGVQKFRAEEFGLPDLPDDELVQYFTTHPLPAWYRSGINFDIHTATGPDDERFPPTTIKAVFRYTQDPGMEARYACWAEEFIAEVQVCVERFRGSDELPHELARLIAELQAFNIGDGEAKNCITALRSTTAGANALNIVQAGKDRLLLRLEKVATTATTKPKPVKEWPNLKCLALFHAYRYEAKDPSAEITKENCEQVALAAGKTAKSSGKELLTYFHRYAYGRNRFNERTKEGKRRGDVLNRLNTVIKKLEDYPEARTIAEEERKAVRDRSNEGED